MPAITDRGLWRRAVDGDHEAFGELYERHADAIYNFCFRRTADWALAEDLTATVFLEAWRKRRRVVFDDDDAVRPWLFGVANNVVRNESRRLRRLGRALAGLGAPRPAPGAADRAEDEARMREVLAAVGRLPRREQDVLAVCVFADLTYEEAAIALGIPIGTVRSRLARARNRLGELSPERGHERANDASSLPRASG
ncbi:MAG TPA: sigma-70 family RNA polymerase sigma factor [Gaiellaceae bacterium]|jgi:RNA polymerase sigma-70 factor (ECF subfamily)